MYKNKALWLGVAVVVLGLVIWFFSTNSASTPNTSINNPPPPSETSDMPQTANCKPTTFDEAAFKKAPVPSGDTVILTVAGFGDIKIKLSSDAKKTSDNFKKLVAAKFYDCISFHRIAPGFVIQGGDPKGDGTGGPGFTVPAEIKLLHKRGSIAMARLPDSVNPKRDSSGSQFYIALQDLPSLDGEYTVFGEVVEGMDTVEKISKVELVPAGVPDGPPKDPVIIEKAVMVN